VFNPTADNRPQPPKVLKTPVEILASLRQLQLTHDPLLIRFHERTEHFKSALVEIDPVRGLMALDEMFPTDGERFLNNGEAFHVEAFHDGVRIVWECQQPVAIAELQGARCYWSALPSEMLYHQRRNAYRAPLKPALPIKAKLLSDKLHMPADGHLLDISATGCKLRFKGNMTEWLQTGQIYENFSAELPFGAMHAAVELRHLQYHEKLDLSFVGLRFSRLTGLKQRQIERFVYQLQRDARRNDDE
jgi:c-di-GMP-binding flagellar brake protein YcgR